LNISGCQQPPQRVRQLLLGFGACHDPIPVVDGRQVTITVDGTSRGPVPRFDRYCTYHRLATLHIASGFDPDQVHEVVVEIHPDQPDRSSVVDRVKDEPHYDPKKYDGTCLRVGAILLVGELVP
jgi:hypothetical protein